MRVPPRPSPRMSWVGMASLASMMLLLVTCLVFIDGDMTSSGRMLDVMLANLGWDAEQSSAGSLTIDVKADGQVEVAGKHVDTADLDERIRQHVAETSGNSEVRIQGPREVAFRQVVPVMAACARAHVRNVSIAIKAN